MKRILAAALLLFVACSASGRASSLKTDVGDFARYMRWGMIEKAADLVPAARRISFIAQKRAAQASMVIHEYDITAVEPDATGERARVLIQATWSRQNDPVMRTELMEQTWQWSERRWQMIEQKPVSTEAPTTPDQGL